MTGASSPAWYAVPVDILGQRPLPDFGKCRSRGGGVGSKAASSLQGRGGGEKKENGIFPLICPHLPSGIRHIGQNDSFPFSSKARENPQAIHSATNRWSEMPLLSSTLQFNSTDPRSRAQEWQRFDSTGVSNILFAALQNVKTTPARKVGKCIVRFWEKAQTNGPMFTPHEPGFY